MHSAALKVTAERSFSAQQKGDAYVIIMTASC